MKVDWEIKCSSMSSRGVAANRGFDWVIPGPLMQTDLTTMVCLKRLN